MHDSRAGLARVRAALDASPFTDPVMVDGAAMPRAEARRIERELVRKFAAPVLAPGGDRFSPFHDVRPSR